MITFVQCIRKKPGMSIQEFRREWKAYQDKAAELARSINAVGLSFHTTLAVEENLQVMLTRGTSEPYDGIAQMRITNAPRTIEALGREPARSLMLEFQAMQARFIDLEGSAFFFTAEETVIRR